MPNLGAPLAALRRELLNGEIFYSLAEARIVGPKAGAAPLQPRIRTPICLCH